MDNLKLIDEMDQALGTIDASRAAHAEIQGYMKYFRQQAQVRQAKAAKKEEQDTKIDSKQRKNKKGE